MRSRIKYERKYTTESAASDSYKVVQSLWQRSRSAEHAPEVVIGWIDEQVFPGTPFAVNRFLRWLRGVLEASSMIDQPTFEAQWNENIVKQKSKERTVVAYLMKAHTLFP